MFFLKFLRKGPRVNYLGAIPIAIGTRGIERKFKFDFYACLPTKAGPPERNGQASVGTPAAGRFKSRLSSK